MHACTHYNSNTTHIPIHTFICIYIYIYIYVCVCVCVCVCTEVTYMKILNITCKTLSPANMSSLRRTRIPIILSSFLLPEKLIMTLSWPGVHTTRLLCQQVNITRSITELTLKQCYSLKRRCQWCNWYRRRIWTRRHEFKSWTRLIAFHIALIPLGKVWIQ